MRQTIARALLQPDRNFPLDCETLDTLQTNLAVVQTLGNYLGDKAILRGCELEPGGSTRKSGYVFLRTADYPNGEVLYWEGGTSNSGMYLRRESVPVTSQGYEFAQAYTVRSLAPGVGDENYNWDDFSVPLSPRQAYDGISGLRSDLAAIKIAPLGVIEMWAGSLSRIPDGYGLCDGQKLNINDYKALYATIGTTFNSAPNATGASYTTPGGYFRLPDLSGRFVVGYDAADSDYTSLGRAGGRKKVTLAPQEIPAHSHNFKDYYYIENQIGGIDGQDRVGSGLVGSGGSDGDNAYLFYKNNTTTSIGGGAAHENRPPYYVLAYIMRLK